MTRRTSRLVCLLVKKKSCQQNIVSQTPEATETWAAARQKIEVEQKCVKRRKQCENESVRRDSASIPGKNDEKNEMARIVVKEIDKRRMTDLEH